MRLAAVAFAVLVAFPAYAGETFTLPSGSSLPIQSKPTQSGGFVVGNPNPALRPWAGQRWEYLCLTPEAALRPMSGSNQFVVFGKDWRMSLEELGAHGWELVGIDNGGHYFFKRPAAD